MEGSKWPPSPPPNTVFAGRHQQRPGHWGVEWQEQIEEAQHVGMAVGSPLSRGDVSGEHVRTWHGDYAQGSMVSRTTLPNGGAVIATEEDDSEETREDENRELDECNGGEHMGREEAGNGHEQEDEDDEGDAETAVTGVDNLAPNWLGHYHSMMGQSVEQGGGRVQESQGVYEACAEDNGGRNNVDEEDEDEEDEDEEEEEDEEDEEDDEEHEKRTAAGQEFIDRQMAGECGENPLQENRSNHNRSWSHLMEGSTGSMNEKGGEEGEGGGVPREVDQMEEHEEAREEVMKGGEEDELTDTDVREHQVEAEKAPLVEGMMAERVDFGEEGATDLAETRGGRLDVEASDKGITDGSGSREHDGEEREEGEGQAATNGSSGGADGEARQAGGRRKRKLNGNVDVSDEGATVTRRVKKKGSGCWSKVGKRGAKRGGTGKGGGSVSNQRLTNGRSSMDRPDISNMVALNPAPSLMDPDARPGEPIVLSKTHKASQIQIGQDGLSATSWKGYRMVRATRGIVEGVWYFEIKVDHLGETGHTRLGWCNQKGDVQAPVGYDKNGYSYRDLEGVKVHEGYRLPYGEPYGEGDVIGCLINLPDGARYAPKPSQFIQRKGAYYLQQDASDEPLQTVPGSEIMFVKNGVCQGVAFENIYAGQYFPAASMYTLPTQAEGCTVSFNFGPLFWVPPKILKDGVELVYQPMSKALSFIHPTSLNPENPLENNGSREDNDVANGRQWTIGNASAGPVPGGGSGTVAAVAQERTSTASGWNTASGDTCSNGARTRGGPKRRSWHRGESKMKGVAGLFEGSTGGEGEEDESVERAEREVGNGGAAGGRRRDRVMGGDLPPRKGGGVLGGLRRVAGRGQHNRIREEVSFATERPSRGAAGVRGAGSRSAPRGSWGGNMAAAGKSKPRSTTMMDRPLDVVNKKALGKAVGRGRGATGTGGGLKTKGLVKNLQEHGLKVKGLKRLGVK